MAIALFEIPVSGWTCLRTKTKVHRRHGARPDPELIRLTLVDVRGIGLLSRLLALGLLLGISRRGGLLGGRCLLRRSRLGSS